MRYLFALPLFYFLNITTALAHGMSDEDKQRILDAGNWEYLQLGAKHMLTGYDHLLFLFGVIFFLTKFRDILIFITAFTAGHCITLIACLVSFIIAEDEVNVMYSSGLTIEQTPSTPKGSFSRFSIM